MLTYRQAKQSRDGSPLRRYSMTRNLDGYVINVDKLPRGENASTFDGHQHGAQVSFFLSHN
jgi:hypothetical protein